MRSMSLIDKSMPVEYRYAFSTTLIHSLMLPYYQLAFMEIIHRSTGISTYITLEIIEQINSFNQKLACDTFLQLCEPSILMMKCQGSKQFPL